MGLFMTKRQIAKERRKQAELANLPPQTIWVHRWMHGYDNPVSTTKPDETEIEYYHEYQLVAKNTA